MSITPPPKKKPKLYQGVLFVPFKSWTSWDFLAVQWLSFHTPKAGGGAWVQSVVADLVSLMPSSDAKKNWTYYLEVGRRGKGWQTFSVKLSNSKYFRLCLCHPIFVQILRCLVSNSVGQLSVSWGQVSRKTIFSSDWEARDGFRMIQVHYIHGALYFYYY